jgi:ribonuclease HIII
MFSVIIKGNRKGVFKLSNCVLKLSNTTISKMKKNYESYIQTKQPTGSIFFAKIDGCTITAYRSGKVLFQGRGAEEEAKQWGSNQQTRKPDRKKQGLYAPPDNISSLSIIGSDEVGTGDYFGPMTVVAAYVGNDTIDPLKKLGVKDSKLMKDWQIIDVAQQTIPRLTYTLLTLDNNKYNELQEKGMTQGKMKAMLHNQALRHTIDKLDGARYDGILIDQFAQPEVYFKHISEQSKQVKENVFFATKAEGLHLSVAAASIIARYAFLKEMDRLSEKAGIELPKGAGDKVDKAAAKFLRTKGEKALRGVAKIHFANTKKAGKLAEFD